MRIFQIVLAKHEEKSFDYYWGNCFVGLKKEDSKLSFRGEKGQGLF